MGGEKRCDGEKRKREKRPGKVGMGKEKRNATGGTTKKDKKTQPGKWGKKNEMRAGTSGGQQWSRVLCAPSAPNPKAGPDHHILCQ